MTSLLDRDWVAIDGTLESISFGGFADDRFSPELAELVISAYSAPGDWILDPFAGLGTSLVTAQALGRFGIGFERNPERARWAAERLSPPNRLIGASCTELDSHELPQFTLAFTSPPYITVRLEETPGARAISRTCRPSSSRSARRCFPRARSWSRSPTS